MPKLSDAIHKVNKEEAKRKRPVKRRPYLDNLTTPPLADGSERAELPVKKTKASEPKPLPEIKTPKSQEEILRAQIPGKITAVGVEDTPPTIAPQVTEAKTTPKQIPIIEKPVLQLKPISEYLPEEIKQPRSTKPRPSRTPNVINNSHAHVDPRGTMGTDEEDGVDLSLYNFEQFGQTTKTVLLYIFRKAKENKCLVTPPIKKNDLLKECGINLNTIKSVLQRLSHYKFIKLEKFQRGPFGWTRYSIRESLYNELLYSYDQLNSGITIDRPESNPAVSNTYGVGEDITIPDTLKEQGFNMGHVKQLQKMQITSDKIQNSLDAFAFDMQDKEFQQKIRSPLAVFMKVAKTEGEYISSRGYVSPEDEILQQMIQLKKDRALHAKKQQEELLNLSFNEWLATKTKDEINKIFPPSGDYLGPLHKATLKNWYQENVFDNKSQ